MPKAELHVHIEGTLEPELSFELARKNDIQLPYATVDDVVKAYDFHDLPSFLSIYYAAMDVLRTESDFFDLSYQYLTKAHSQNIVYVEIFFDPQAHTSRGVDFETVINGIRNAQLHAEKTLGIASQLILCFLRDMSAASAMEHLLMAEPFKQWIVGVGLDSDEKDNPPTKFADVFAAAREMGFRLTMHCDVNQQNTHKHIRQCLDEIRVDRIDHGVNCLEQDDLWQDIQAASLALTVCPVSNRFVVQSLTSSEIRMMLERDMLVTINSDDPAYFRAYLNENLLELSTEGDFTKQEITTLVSNGFKAAWITEEQRKDFIRQLADYVENSTS